jgi:AcrR family transcriptional regulator
MLPDPHDAPIEGDARSLATRQRLLDIAGETFGREGFAGATIREICKQAGVNIAAVNYHFGDKAGLYNSAIQHARSQSAPDVPVTALLALPAPARLRAFIAAMLSRILDKTKPHWHTQVMLREMVEPTRELDSFVRFNIRPQWDMLRGIVREVTGLHDDDPRVWLAACSIVSQVLLYKHGEPVVSRLYAQSPVEAFRPDQHVREPELRVLAEHICAFSLHGLAGLREASGLRRDSKQEDPC